MARLFVFIACLAVAFAVPTNNAEVGDKAVSDAEVAEKLGDEASDVMSDYNFGQSKGGFQMAGNGGYGQSKGNGGFGFAYGGKGNSLAAKMQLEAMMCPMTTYQLAKSKKEQMEGKLMMEAQGAANNMLQVQKLKMEAELEECNNNLAEVSGALDQAKSDLDACNEALASEQAVNEGLSQELAATQADLAAEQANNERLSAELAATQEDLDKERQAREMLMATMGVIETTADEVQDNVNEILGL